MDAVHSGIHTAMTKAVHTVVIKLTVVNAADAIVVVCTVVGMSASSGSSCDGGSSGSSKTKYANSSTHVDQQL